MDAGQDPALVLLVVCVEGADTHAEDGQEADDEGDEEARPDAMRVNGSQGRFLDGRLVSGSAVIARVILLGGASAPVGAAS